ncbi:TetR/AcrR family transcriptional regulator [Cryptosporangium phraense]|uniref:TetR/AcrR family transcriptional regulator n=1 Tax=Cryptosporangium phraense TaxID=2593070 RepID=A0A545AUI7_9ACTN|nr:TetR/AcrR family transcriptional regulator [Cryptosporangium phraense]TQS44996.1 TetR/AcrR family transcriptional regulator [Cryptosporangium phraense]
MTTPYQRAQAAGQDALRRTVLDAAGALLVSEGPQALTMRKVSGEIGCSTTVLYTMFGGKDGLAEALYREGFARLRARLVAAVDAAGDDPAERLAATARAYRENALAERAYYGVMFGQAIPGFTPSAEALAESKRAFDVLGESVAALGGGRAPEPDVDPTNLLWAVAHGVVSFELAGHYPDEKSAAAAYRTALTAVSAYLGLR